MLTNNIAKVKQSFFKCTADNSLTWNHAAGVIGTREDAGEMAKEEVS